MTDGVKPLGLSRVWTHLRARAPVMTGTAGAIVLALLLMLILGVIWRFTALADLVTGERLRALLAAAAQSGWAPVLVLATYLLAGLIVVPISVLIVATAATFGPWVGFAYAATGVFTSAILTYGIGAWMGRNMVRTMLGARWEKAHREIDDCGFLAVITVRVVPVVPFAVFNLVAGACAVRFVDYVAGTVIGMLPGLIVVSAMGRQIDALFTDLSLTNIALFVLAALAWMAQRLIVRLRRRSP
jgi:uncharacterized membrane protein YdjX (TVP38/TMEM64 family)